MILNRLIVPEGNNLVFDINHTVDGEKYQLKENEMYYIKIGEKNSPYDILTTFETQSGHFEFNCGLSFGEYVFEIGINDGDLGVVILPAFDEKNRPVNQLLILRRL